MDTDQIELRMRCLELAARTRPALDAFAPSSDTPDDIVVEAQRNLDFAEGKVTPCERPAPAKAEMTASADVTEEGTSVQFFRDGVPLGPVAAMKGDHVAAAHRFADAVNLMNRMFPEDTPESGRGGHD